MIEAISHKILNFIIMHSDIDEDMSDIYKYGIEITISSILNFALIFIASAIIGDFLSGVVFLATFILLRSYCGGYHADTYFKCNTVFVFTYILIILISRASISYISFNLSIWGAILLLSFVPILLYSPVKNIHKVLTESQCKRCRLISIVVYFMLSLISLFLIGIRNNYGCIIIITLAAVSVMILIEVHKKRRENHADEKKNF